MSEAHGNEPNPQNPNQGLVYLGGALSLIGLALFISNFFVIGCAMDEGFGAPPNMGGFMFRALGGMALMVLGGAVGKGKHLAAGAARPTMTPRPPVVKVRCPGCQSLQDEDARFCDQCGKALSA